MDELFQTIKGNPTHEEKVEIAKTGRVPAKYKDNSTKEYIVLIKLIGDDEDEEILFDYQAFLCVGRDETWEKIKQLFMLDEGYEIDVRNSCILVEGVDISDRISLYKFVKHCEQLYGEDINIDYYLDEIMMQEEENKPQATGFGNSGTVLGGE